VAHLQGNVLPRMQHLTRENGVRQVVSPPLALSRIVAYDRARGTVTVLVSRSSAGWEANRGDCKSGDLYRASGATYSAEGGKADTVLRLAGHL
jgi:hypothetical protein